MVVDRKIAGFTMNVFLFIGLTFITFKAYNLFILFQDIENSNNIQLQTTHLLIGVLFVSGVFLLKINALKKQAAEMHKEIKTLKKTHVLTKQEVHDEAMHQLDEEHEMERQHQELRAQEAEQTFNTIIGQLEDTSEKISDEKVLKSICNGFQAVQGALYAVNEKEYSISATYAKVLTPEDRKTFDIGEGFVGEAIKEKRLITLKNIPQDYIKVYSGLGKTSTAVLTYIPIESEGIISKALEMAFFRSLDEADEKLLNRIAKYLGAELKETSETLSGSSRSNAEVKEEEQVEETVDSTHE